MLTVDARLLDRMRERLAIANDPSAELSILLRRRIHPREIRIDEGDLLLRI